MKSVSQIQPAKKLFQGERPPETDSQRRGSNPRPSTYEADALPLSYIGTRMGKMPLDRIFTSNERAFCQ